MIPEGQHRKINALKQDTFARPAFLHYYIISSGHSFHPLFIGKLYAFTHTLS